MPDYCQWGFRDLECNVPTNLDSAIKVPFRIRSCGELKWEYSVNVEGASGQRSCFVKLSSNTALLPVQAITLGYNFKVHNRNPDDSRVFTGKWKFHEGEKTHMMLIENYENFLMAANGFVDDQKIKFSLSFVVEEARMIDCVELIDIFTSNSNINDVIVVVNNNNELHLLKSLLRLQSSYFTELFKNEKTRKVELDVNGFKYENVCDFFQIVHGADMSLDEDNIEDMLKMAEKFKFPRITEMCKKLLVDPSMSVNKSVDFATRFGFWDVVPTILGNAESLSEIKKQGWQVKNLSDENTRLMAKRVFELSIKTN